MSSAGGSPPRVGRIDFVNCFPLYVYFEEELARLGMTAEVVEGSPTELNRMLVAGRIDLTFCSSIEYARHADVLTVLGDLAIGSVGAVDSVQLFSKVPVEQLRTIALSEKSATSVCLLRLLCEEWGISPEYAPRLQPLSETLARFDALLLIGDEALHVLRDGVYPIHVDLGEAWYQVTGLPMVFAVCGVRRDFLAMYPEKARALQTALLASRDRCAERPCDTAAAAALIYDFTQRYLYAYFEKLRYDFSEQQRLGLTEFYRRAAALGELVGVPPVPGVLAASECRASAYHSDRQAGA